MAQPALFRRRGILYHNPVGLHDTSEPPGAAAPAEAGTPSAAARERYQVHGPLGRGGAASVLLALDTVTGRKVALKRLQPHPDPGKRRRNAELFEREFHTLSQLAHPRIVEVYDYGVDTAGPYYSMELLEGGDLHQLAPLPWRTACAIARDVASALSLLHSRRFVHRDVSPRNVRRTADGDAKLIDFGAIAPMGPSRFVVGTPPCCAPENVHMQTLDGRTDLFALGATLYYVLVGRHAYSARHFSDLSEAWQSGVVRPSELLGDIPEALDALVLDLLRLEPDERPANAAEVIERLTAIDGDTGVEQLQVAKAYLTMPTLIGRDIMLARMHRKLKRATHSRSRTVLIEGPPGVGRSRFLDASVLDAALLGAVCTRADAEDAMHREYGVLRALVRRLSTVLPVVTELASAEDLPLLTALSPELAPTRNPSQPLAASPVAVPRPDLQAAFLRWFRAVCGRVPLLIGVDDVHRIDEASAAVLSLLAHDAPSHLALVVTAESGATWRSPPAQKLLQKAASRLELEPLSRDDVEKLLASLFGGEPNLIGLSHRVHEASGGLPREVMRLAQHLVERGTIHYEAGAWTLPPRLEQIDVPSCMASALAARLEVLSEDARRLALTLALCPDQSFDAGECAQLCAPRTAAEWRRDAAELLKAEVGLSIDDRLRLAKAHWIGPLRAGVDPELERRLHGRLAEVLKARGQDFRAGQHYLRAGEHERGLDVLVAHARTSQDETARDSEVFTRYAQALPADWLDTFLHAISLCEQLGRPKRDLFYLRGRLAGLVPAFGVDDKGQVGALLADLTRDSGLREFEKLDPTLPPHIRIARAVQLAEARYAATPENERVLPPGAALNVLVRGISAASGRAPIGMDVPYLRSLPSLEPFAPISPAAALLHDIVRGMDARFTGRTERAREIYYAVLERLNQPGHAGLDPSYGEFTRLGIMNGLGMVEASMGMASGLEWAERISRASSYQAHAVQTRALYYIYQGNIHAAEDCKRELEKLRLQSVQLYETSHLFWEVGAYLLAEDLTRLRHAIEAVGPFAQRYPAWTVVHHYVGAEYHRIRRDPARALAAIQPELARAAPGVHPLWANVATTQVRALDDLGRHTEALAAAEAHVETADAADLGHIAEPLRQALAICRARAGAPGAAQTADAVLERYAALGVRGLLLGAAHEARARVALLLDDRAGYEQHADACRDAYCAHKNSALVAKYKRLRQEGEPRVKAGSRRGFDLADAYGNSTGMRMVSALEFCRGSDERARLALTILVRNSGAAAGFMFTFGVHGLECVGSVGGYILPDSLLPRIARYYARHIEAAPTTSTDSEDPSDREPDRWVGDDGRMYRPVLLSHNPGGGTSVSGVVVLVLADPNDFRYPLEIAAAISRFYAECGDTSLLMLAD